MFTLSGHSELAVIARVHTLTSHLPPLPFFSFFERDILSRTYLEKFAICERERDRQREPITRSFLRQRQRNLLHDRYLALLY